MINILGFESRNLLEVKTYSGSVALETGTVRTGNNSLKIQNHSSYAELSDANGNSLARKYMVVRFYVYTSSAPFINEEIFRFHYASGNINIRIMSGGSMSLYNDTTSLASQSFSLNTWHCVEIGLFPGKVVWRVNGSTVSSPTITDQNWTNVYIGSFSNRNSQNYTCYFDDITITEDYFPGSGEIYNLAPTAATNLTVGNINDYSTGTESTLAATTSVITSSSYNNLKTIRFYKPWVIARSSDHYIKHGNKKTDFTSNGSNHFHGVISSAKDQARWNGQPDFSLTSTSSLVVAEAGVMVEYGNHDDPYTVFISDPVSNNVSRDFNIVLPNPTLMQFDLNPTNTTTVVVLGVCLFHISGNKLFLEIDESAPVEGTTTLNNGTWYNIKIFLSNEAGISYKVLINDILEFQGSYTSSNWSASTIVFGTSAIRNVIVTRDIWHSNVEVYHMPPTGSGSPSNYTGSYTSIDEYPFSNGDSITLSGTSGGAGFAVTAITQKIWALSQFWKTVSGYTITVLGVAITTTTLEDYQFRGFENGLQWASPSNIRIDFSGTSGTQAVYGLTYLVLRTKPSANAFSPFLLFI